MRNISEILFGCFRRDVKKQDIQPQDLSFEDIYEVKHLLGQGASSVVHLVRNKLNGELAALKVIPKFSMVKNRKVLEREVSFLRSLSGQHENVAALLPEHSFFETDSEFKLVMELCSGGELLFSIVERGSYCELDAVKLVAQVLSAVAFCHERGIVHRDLKPENLMLKDNTSSSKVMVVDFGLSKLVEFEGELFQTACGTPMYCAPEVYKKEGHSKPCDMWSVGCITYVLLSGCSPFYAEGLNRSVGLILSAKFSFPDSEWKHISSDAKDFISQLLRVNPTERLTAHEALEHSWIIGCHKVDMPDLIETLKRSTLERRTNFQTLKR